jgi:hypothetical protein
VEWNNGVFLTQHRFVSPNLAMKIENGTLRDHEPGHRLVPLLRKLIDTGFQFTVFVSCALDQRSG